MASHRVVTNGVVYEVEDGERLKPKGADEVELLKCGCTGNGCGTSRSKPGAGFVVRNTGTHRVRVSIQILSGWDCGRLEPGDVATCPACGSAMQPVHDVVHRAMARTIEQAGRVEVVHGDAAGRLLQAGGGLGALVRFRATVVPVVA